MNKVSSYFYQFFGLVLSSLLKLHRTKGRHANLAWQKATLGMTPLRQKMARDWSELSKTHQSIWWLWVPPSVPHGGVELDIHMSFPMFFLLLPLLLRHPCCYHLWQPARQPASLCSSRTHLSLASHLTERALVPSPFPRGKLKCREDEESPNCVNQAGHFADL